jgi:hypothetical protein
MDHPGLIKREVVRQDDETVVLRETWDLSAPGCPLIGVTLNPFGLLDPDGKTCTRTLTVPRAKFSDLHIKHEN